MDQQELEKSNRSKYGDKSNDLIAQAYQNDQYSGDFWCIWNMRKYIERYIRKGSSKAGNLTDLIKARDYLQRAIDNHLDKEKPLTEKNA